MLQVASMSAFPRHGTKEREPKLEASSGSVTRRPLWLPPGGCLDGIGEEALEELGSLLPS